METFILLADTLYLLANTFSTTVKQRLHRSINTDINTNRKVNIKNNVSTLLQQQQQQQQQRHLQLLSALQKTTRPATTDRG